MFNVTSVRDVRKVQEGREAGDWTPTRGIGLSLWEEEEEEIFRKVLNFQVKNAGFCAFLRKKLYLWPENVTRGLKRHQCSRIRILGFSDFKKT